MANTVVCLHCGEPIMKFTFRDEGEQWWHANPAVSPRTSRHCYGDPRQPVAEPAEDVRC